MMLVDIIQGTRVGSPSASSGRASHDDKPLTKTDRRILRAIPYWPREIKVGRLAEKVRLSGAYVSGRIQKLTFRTRIFDSRDGYVSRLREDLSNVD